MKVAKQEPSALRVLSFIVGTELAALVTLVMTVWLYEPYAVASTFWGGIVFLVPCAYSSYYAFRHRGAQQVYLVTMSILRGQRGKTLLTAVGFALAFQFVKPLYIGYLFGGYIFLLIVHVAVAAKVSKRFGHPELSTGAKE